MPRTEARFYGIAPQDFVQYKSKVIVSLAITLLLFLL